MRKEKSVFCNSEFTATSLTATVKHTADLQVGEDNLVFQHNGCVDSCAPRGQNCNSFSPQAMYSLLAGTTLFTKDDYLQRWLWNFRRIDLLPVYTNGNLHWA